MDRIKPVLASQVQVEQTAPEDQKIESKVTRLKRFLAGNIGNGLYSPGGCLPSERDLERIHQVSRTTVRLALQQLETEGIVQCKHGSGAYVQCRPAARPGNRDSRASWRVAFIFRSNRAANPFLQRVFEVFRASVPPHIATCIHFHDLPKPALYRRERTNLLIVDGGFDDEQLDVMRRTGIPTIAILREWKAGNYICTDNFRGGYMMIEYLAQHGHRHVVGLGASGRSGASPTDEMEQRRRGMQKAASDLNVDLVWPPRSALEDAKTFHQLIDAWFGPGHSFTAAASAEPLPAVQLYDIFEDRHIRIPEEVSIICYDNTYYHAWLSTPMTVVKQPFEKMALQLAHAANALASGKPLRLRRKLPPVIVEQASVKTIPSTHSAQVKT